MRQAVIATVREVAGVFVALTLVLVWGALGREATLLGQLVEYGWVYAACVMVGVACFAWRLHRLPEPASPETT